MLLHRAENHGENLLTKKEGSRRRPPGGAAEAANKELNEMYEQCFSTELKTMEKTF